MGTKNSIGRVNQLYYTSAIWMEKNPILNAGEIGIESDTYRIKAGDGKTHWNELTYFTTLAPQIMDNLTSTDKMAGLSANQGRVLNEKFNNYVPTTRTINGKALSSNVVLYTGTVTPGQVLVADGNTGLYKSSGYTIESNVPVNAKFTDNNYYYSKLTWAKGTTEGPVGTLVGTNGGSNLELPAIPIASDLQSGVVSTSAQKFAGSKTFTDTITGSITGNAGTATKLKTPFTLTLGTDLSGSVSIDGSGGVTLNASVVNNSHSHTSANISDLSNTLAPYLLKNTGKANMAVITDGTGNIIPSGKVTVTELNYLDGVTSGIQTQLNNKLNTSLKGKANGLAELDANGQVPAAQLPSYVDDVLEFTDKTKFPTTGESSKIYVDTTANLTYRWSGTTYIEISKSLGLGTTHETAFYGDLGQTAYTHSQLTSGNPHKVSKSDVGLGNVANKTEAEMVASGAISTALAGKVPTTRKVNGKVLSGDINLYTGTWTANQVLVADTAAGDYKASGFVLQQSVTTSSKLTDHYYSSFAWANGTTSGPTGTLTGVSGTSNISFPAIPVATDKISGVVSTGEQSFAGKKKFLGGIEGTLAGTADAANKLATERNITLTGDVSGSAYFNGTKDISITTTVANNSHSHTLSNISDFPTAVTTDQVNALINKLETGSSTPVDADYYISQYVNGGSTTTTYHRRPMSALWSYIKGKGDGVFAPLSHTQAISTITGLQSALDGKVPSGRTVNGKALSSNITLYSGTLTSGQVLIADGTAGVYKTSGFTLGMSVPAGSKLTDTNYYPSSVTWTGGTTAGPTGTLVGSGGMSNVSIPAIPAAGASASGIVTTGNQTFAGTKTFNSTIAGSINGNAGTATTLQTARTLTIGNTGKSFNGSANVSWSLSEIGAAAASHSHSYLPLSGGSITGPLLVNANANAQGSYDEGIRINQGKNGYATLTIGGAANSTSGTTDGQWWIGCNPGSYGRKLYLAFNGSTGSNTYFYSSSSGQVSPAFYCEGGVNGAVWNDLADSIPLGDGDIVEPGYCYCFDGEHYTKTSEYMQQSYIGIHSDTYGFRMGFEEGKEKLDAAVSGFVLAYVDKDYPVGTPLTCTKDGYLTEISKEDKKDNPDMIVAKYWKSESAEEWGTDSKKVKVNGRHWVKIV